MFEEPDDCSWLHRVGEGRKRDAPLDAVRDQDSPLSERAPSRMEFKQRGGDSASAVLDEKVDAPCLREDTW